MRLIKIYLILSIGIFSGCGEINGYDIIGKATNANATIVVLSMRENGLWNGDLMPIDTSNVINGKFEFHGQIDFPEVRYLQFFENGVLTKELQIFLENSRIRVNIRNNSAQITGSKIHDAFSEFNNRTNEILEPLKSLNIEIEKARDRNDSLSMINLLGKKANLYSKVDDFTLETIKSNLDNPLGPFIAQQLYYTPEQLDELKNLVDSFSPEVYQSIYYGNLERRISYFNNIQIGKTLPSNIITSSNDTIHLKYLVRRYLLVDIWASWCSPCIKELPKLRELYEAYNDSNFDIVGISLDRNVILSDKIIHKFNLGWTNFYETQGWDSPMVNQLGVESLPYKLLLDVDLKILAINPSIENIKDFILEK